MGMNTVNVLAHRRKSRMQTFCSHSPVVLNELLSSSHLNSCIVMLNNSGNAVGLYGEISTMNERLDVYKHAGRREDRFLNC